MTHYSQEPRSRRLKSAGVVLLASMVIVSACGRDTPDDDPDRQLAPGGNFPAGWSVRPDRGSATNVRFSQIGDVFRFAMGPAGTFYNNEWTKTGDFQFSARLTQVKAPSHPISYGLMIGGANLTDSNQTYSYFLVRNEGDYFIANRDGDKRTVVVDWTKQGSINKQGPDGRQTNALGIQIQGDNAIFTVNGTEVTRLPKSRVHTDGLYGLRIGHNLDVDVDQVMR